MRGRGDSAELWEAVKELWREDLGFRCVMLVALGVFLLFFIAESVS